MGPRTEAGKSIFQLNAVRHGLRAATVIVPGRCKHGSSLRVVVFHSILATLNSNFTCREDSSKSSVSPMTSLPDEKYVLAIRTAMWCRGDEVRGRRHDWGR